MVTVAGPTNRQRSEILKNLISPYGLATISFALFLLGCLIPPFIYSYYIHEPDLMFCDSTTILFFSLCVVFFLVGVWFISFLFPASDSVVAAVTTKISPVLFILVPLVTAVALCMVSNILMVKQNPLIIPLILAQQASQLRAGDDNAIDFSGTLNIFPLFLTGILWWAQWRFFSIPGLTRKARVVVGITLACAVLDLVITSTLAVSRQGLVVALTGLACCYFLGKAAYSNLSWTQILRPLTIFGVGAISFFYLINSIRYGFGAGIQLQPFIGYTLASYNRLAALLLGKLHYEYTAKGIYFSNFLAFNRSINSILPYGHYMNLPDYFDWWRSAFTAVGNAGLDAGLIYCGSFGELYIEVGWFAPLCLLGYGMVVGLLWQQMRKRSIVGIILYPYCAYYILFWFTSNSLFDTIFAALSIDVALLGIYEHLFGRRSSATEAMLTEQ